MRSAPRSSAAASTRSTRSMFWRWSTTLSVSGQPSSRTVRAAATLRSNDGGPGLRAASVGWRGRRGDLPVVEAGVVQLGGPLLVQTQRAGDEVRVEAQFRGGPDDLPEVAA